MEPIRLDILVTEKGIARSREAAKRLIEDGKVTVETSEAAEIRFTTGIRKSKRFLAKDGVMLTEATYELPTDKDPYYFRVTVTDKNGKFAYTNAYFTDELTDYLAKPAEEVK